MWEQGNTREDARERRAPGNEGGSDDDRQGESVSGGREGRGRARGMDGARKRGEGGSERRRDSASKGGSKGGRETSREVS